MKTKILAELYICISVPLTKSKCRPPMQFLQTFITIDDGMTYSVPVYN